MGTSRHGAGADAGRSVWWARCGGAVGHLAQVAAFLARCAPACDLWQRLGAQFTATRERNGQPPSAPASADAPSYRRIHQLEAQLEHIHHEPMTEVPALIPFDGIPLGMQTQHDDIHQDSRQRKRQRKRGKRMGVLVALGLWTDGSRKRRILDWQVTEQEEQAAWERLVQRCWERGVKLETGL